MAESPLRVSRAPRLFIKEMIMRNFKSYAGEQCVGPFHKSFSAVVVLNPNGSGKSNIIDAMLFVFGKRAKQEGETYDAVPGSDFVITCVAFRDNSSNYFVNVQSSNFTEGEVEQISLMKPKAQVAHDEGFLEYLEDIIGTNKYVEKIAESFKQEKIRENNKTLKELESKHSKHLQKQKEFDNSLRRCKAEFKEFERQDVKYREDLSHLKHKIKKLKMLDQSTFRR